jgi:hypothetical protein
MKAKNITKKGRTARVAAVAAGSYSSPRALLKRLYNLSYKMQSVGAQMEYQGGFSELGQHGRELQGAAGIALGWARALEAQNQLKTEK